MQSNILNLKTPSHCNNSLRERRTIKSLIGRSEHSSQDQQQKSKSLAVYADGTGIANHRRQD